MENLSLDKTFTNNPLTTKFLSVSSLNHSRTLCFPRKSNKVVVFTYKYDNSSSLASGVLSRTLFSARKSKRFVVFASTDDNKLDQWDQMELKFGRMIGEDPKLTLAKIISRKTNPDTSYLEIEESFGKKKGKTSGEIVEVPFDGSKGKNSVNSSNGLNLVRPVPKKGVKFEVDDKPLETKGAKQSPPISKPAVSRKSSVPNVILRKPTLYSEEDESLNFKIKPNLTLKMGKELKPEKFSNVTLLKKPEPMRINSDNDEMNEQSSDVLPAASDDTSDITLLKKPETMRVDSDNDEKNGQSSDVLPAASDDTSDVTLLKKPKPMRVDSDNNEKNEQSSDVLAVASDDTNDVTLLKKPEPMRINSDKYEKNEQSSDVLPEASDETADASPTKGYASSSESKNSSVLTKPEPRNLNPKRDLNLESFGDQRTSVLHESVNAAISSLEQLSVAESKLGQPLETSRSNPLEEQGSGTGFQQTDSWPAERSSDCDRPSETGSMESLEAALLGKPKRLDQPKKKATSSTSQEDMRPVNSEGYGNASEIDNFLAKSPIKEHEDNDWVRAEELVKSGGRDEVELISCSTRGFVASFGSLLGFLPYRNLAARWKFLAFESWLRRKGLDPSLYKQGLGIIGSYDGFGKAASTEAGADPQIAQSVEEEISPDMKLEDLLRIYDQEKLKFLSSFVGQRVRVSVVLAERNSRRLIFSIKQKEKEELVEKKRSLMAKLQVGDVVKCSIQKITYFGIFVEVEGVPALIHQTEVSWDATLDPASYFKIGQIVEAKVHQLDFSLERIFLSLKEITPDPMMEALEAVVGDHDNLNGELQAAEQDTEWPEVDSLIKELQQFEGISSVSKGRYFLSPGLAPTFQVYMASMFESQYKLLARSGNRVQELMVETSLGKEQMKSAIQSCTNKVQ